MITDLNSLQSTVSDWLNRTDLASVVPTFVQLAEVSFRRDHNLRRLTSTELTLDDEVVELPSALLSIESWSYADSARFRDPILIVPADRLAELSWRREGSGVPLYAAVIDDRHARLAPPPTEPVESFLTYWEGIPALADGSPTNWLLEEHPDVYLYGALMESAPYLKDDERLLVWGDKLATAVEQVSQSTRRKQWSGNMQVIRRRTFG